MEKWQIINLVILIVFLALIIGLEQVFREPMFTDSLEFQQNWQKDSPGLKGFMNFMSELGTGPILIPMLGITFLFFPINKAYSYLTIMIYGYFLDNILKVWYGNPRPFWLKSDLFLACNGGFGNPSGHSFSSVSSYLAFWHIITDFEFFKKQIIGIILRILLLIFFLIIVILILLSRLFLGAHSTNQILYGGLWGLALYFCVFFVFQWSSKNSEEFTKFFTEKRTTIIYSMIFALFLIASFISYLYIDNQEGLYSDTLDSLCPDHSTYRKFNPDGLFGMLSLFGIIGGHYGLVLLFYLTERNYPNKNYQIIHWSSKGSLKSHILRILICILFGLPLILIFVISGKSSLVVIFIFKVSVPYLLALFGLFGSAIYLSIKFKFANPEIYSIHVETHRNPPSEIGLVNQKNNQNEDISGIPKMKDDQTNIDQTEHIHIENLDKIEKIDKSEQV
jgi:membrane-associated phospholipid phosphatase